MESTLIMEVSWEVCNKIGGIYTVLASRASTMLQRHGDEGVLFVGPLLGGEKQQSEFVEEDGTQARSISKACGLTVKLGRWNVPGNPRVALVDYRPLFEQKGDLYFEMWNKYGIRGELGYGDYDESCIFAIAAAKVMAAYNSLVKPEKSVGIFDEWTTGMGLLYSKIFSPKMGTIFITHATTVGRSIAGNGKPLYGELDHYNGDQMAQELNVVCKHSVEKAAAHHATVFATVSDVTAQEAYKLLGRKVDAVLYNGFEPDLIPSAIEQKQIRLKGRAKIKNMVEVLYGTTLCSEPMIVATSGRNEYRNKGIDVFIESLRKIERDNQRDLIAIIAVPGWVKEPRKDLRFAIDQSIELTLPMQRPFLTHELFDPWDNPIFRRLYELKEHWGGGVFPVLIPDYLRKGDGMLDMGYYEFLSTVDLTIFPSYYEPWGYTPLESVACGVPTITTDKSGFGLWAMGEAAFKDALGVQVLHRDDYNFDGLSTRIMEEIIRYASLDAQEREGAAQSARQLAELANWSHFYQRYEEAMKQVLDC